MDRYGRTEAEARSIAATVVLENAEYALVELKAPSGLQVEYIEVDGVPVDLRLRPGRSARAWYGVQVTNGERVSLHIATTKHRAEALYERVGQVVGLLQA